MVKAVVERNEVAREEVMGAMNEPSKEERRKVKRGMNCQKAVNE